MNVKKALSSLALLFLLGLGLTLGGCGWYGCHHPHGRGHYYSNPY